MAELPLWVRVRPLPPTPPGWWSYGHAVLPDGGLVILSLDTHPETLSKTPARASWENVAMLVRTVDSNGGAMTVELPAGRFPQVARLANDGWLVIAARAGSGQANARRFSADAMPVSSFAIGDGVEHVIVTPDGLVWVGWFDEGVYGGGKDVDGTWPPSSSGIAAFDLNGHCVWRFDVPGILIADSYAMGANGNAIWACTYPGFPILHISGGHVRSWTNSLEGAKAIAAADGHVVLAGGYGADDRRIGLLRLEADAAVLVDEWQLPRVSRPPYLCGRESVMHAVIDDQWLQIPVRDWVEAVRENSDEPRPASE